MAKMGDMFGILSKTLHRHVFIYLRPVSDVSVANEPILLNGSLVRTRGTESYLVRAVLVIVQSLIRTNYLPKSTRLLKSLILFPKRIL